MILRIISLVIIYFFVFNSFAFASDSMVTEPKITFEEFHRNGSKYIGTDVLLVGFLLIDQGMFLYPNLNTFMRYNVRSSVYVAINDYLKYKSLSGCFVEIVGSVGTHKTDENIYQIKDIKYIARTGSLYQIALRRNSGENKNMKCELEAIIDAM